MGRDAQKKCHQNGLFRPEVTQLEDRTAPAVIEVTTLSDSLTGDGQVSLREAILAANTNASVDGSVAGEAGADTITFATGLVGDVNLSSTLGQLEIEEPLTIQGDGRIEVDGQNNTRVFDIDNSAEDVDVTFDGLTIKRGSSSGRGGGILYEANGTLTLVDSQVTENVAANDGGGLWSDSDSGNVTLIRTVISANRTTRSSANGGGIGTFDGLLTLTASTVTGNSTEGDNSLGGGIYSYRGAINVTDSTIAGNFTTGDASQGGGISFGNNADELTTLSVTRSTIADNYTLAGMADGGGVATFNGSATFTDSAIVNNSTAGQFADGGGVYSFAGLVTVANSTVSGNRATGNVSSGGGVYTGSQFSRVVLAGSTVTLNSATAEGGGIHTGGNNTLAVRSSIVAANTDNGINPDLRFAGTPSIIDSLIGDNTGTGLAQAQPPTPDANGNFVGTGANPVDPLLRPLGYYGGPTQSHALFPGSPAVDAGSNQDGFANDQRGGPFARSADGGPDMGAYELQTLDLPTTLVVTTADDEFDPEYVPNDLSLREALSLANGNPDSETVTFDPSLAEVPLLLSVGQLGIGDGVTVLGLGANRTVIDAQQRSRVFDISAGADAVTFDSLTITGGLTTLDSPDNGTAPLYGGGGIRSLSTGTLWLFDSVVRDNETQGKSSLGGGILSWRGSAVLTRSTVSGNETRGDFSSGGGLAVYGDVVLDRSAVSSNETRGISSEGGGVTLGGSLLATDSVIESNETSGENSDGGGLFLGGGATIINSTIADNEADNDFSSGGGLAAFFGLVSIQNSTISGNRTSDQFSDGGGVYIGGFASLDMRNSTVTRNRTNDSNSDGGGVHAENGANVTIISSIIAGNIDSGGDNRFPDLVPNANLSIQNSLIGDNSGSSLGEAPPGSPDGNGNLVGTAANPIDPLLAPLGVYGGPAPTHALLPESPAIDGGANPDGLATDQRGGVFTREFAAGPDMGAFEFQTLDLDSPMVVTVAEDEFDGDFSASDLSLREALELTNGNPGAETITFAESLSGVPLSLTRGQLVIGESVTIQGLGQANTVIDAQGNSRVFDIAEGADAVTFTGLTVTGGRTVDPIEDGGGIRSQSQGVLTLDEVTVRDNSSFDNGGGIFTEGEVILNRSTVSGNSSFDDGGGIFAFDNVTLTNSVVSGNITTGDFANGGGISTFDNVTLTDSVVSGNSTSGRRSRGGGINASDNVTLVNSTVRDNATNGDDAGGGGIFSYSGMVTLTGSTISGNSTCGTSLNFTASGGGIYAAYGDIIATNSTISGNSADGLDSDGGGLFSFSGNISLTNVTVANNYAERDGGGVYLRAFSDNEEVILNGSIIALNTVSSGTGPDLFIDADGDIDSLNSLIGVNQGTGLLSAPPDDSDNDGNIIGRASEPLDPVLSPLGNFGGPTLVHAPLAGSPALDVGSNTGNLTSDQRGGAFLRVVGAGPDMGAVERQPFDDLTLVVDIAADEFDGDYTAGDLSLREALTLANVSAGFETITFAPEIDGQRIQLTLGQLTVGESAAVRGNGPANTVIDAQGGSRVLDILAGAGDVVLEGMTITGGLTTGDNSVGDRAPNSGAGIRSQSPGLLTILDMVIYDNATQGRLAHGGGVWLSEGDLTLTNSIVSNNSTSGMAAFGGGVVLFDGELTLTNSSVVGNSTRGDPIPAEGDFDEPLGAFGGGIVVAGENDLTLTDSTVIGNSTAGDYAAGGGIYAIAADVVFENSTLSDNSTAGDDAPGGGLFVITSEEVRFDLGSTVNSNSTSGVNSAGGGIYVAEPSGFDAPLLVVSNGSTVEGNSTSGANAAGGGIFVADGTTGMSRATIANNFTEGPNSPGGGLHTLEGLLYVDAATVTGNYTLGDGSDGGGLSVAETSDISYSAVRNSTITGNSTDGIGSEGGGIFSGQGDFRVLNSTVVLNQSRGNGGGIYSRGDGQLTVRSSIVAQNVDTTDGSHPDLDFEGDALISDSLIGNNNGTGLSEAQPPNSDFNGNFVGTAANPIDPQLAPLADNGGFTLTHALLANSPAIDSGSNIDGFDFDQRGFGFDRQVNGLADMGAYEFNEFGPAVVAIERIDASRNAPSVQFEVTFSESVTGVDVTDFALTIEGTAQGNISEVTGLDTTYTVTVDELDGEGSIRLNLIDDDSIRNAEDTALGGTGAGNGDFSFGDRHFVDRIAPEVASIVVEGDPTPDAETLSFLVTMSEFTQGADLTDFVLTTTGSAQGTLSSIENLDGSGGGGLGLPPFYRTYRVTVENISGQGAIRLDLIDDDSIIDPSVNPLGGTGTGNGDFTTGDTVTIDQVAPDAPTINAVSEDTGVADDRRTSDTSPEVLGTAEAGATVEVFRDGVSLGTTTADASGEWSYQDADTLTDGSYDYAATATDAAGNTSSESSPLSVTIDATAPEPPTITSVEGDTDTPGDGVTSDQTLVFNGTAEADATVTVSLNGTQLGTTTADPSGAWSYDNTANPLADGTYALTAIATDVAGNASPTSDAFTVTVNSTNRPVIIGVLTGTGEVDGDGVTSDRTPTLTGTSIANATLQLLRDGVLIGTTTSDTEGLWTYTEPSELPDATHVYTARGMDGSGDTADSDPVSVAVDTTAPGAPSVTGVAEDTGVEGDGVTADNTLIISGTAEPESAVEVLLDGAAIGTITADTQGGWSFDYTGTPLADGVYALTAIATDIAGNASPPSEVFTMTIDTANRPVINGVLSSTGEIDGDSITNDTTPTLTGTALANATLRVLRDGFLAGTLTTDGQGAWAFTDVAALADGSYVYSASGTDGDGNTVTSDPVTVVIDATAPIVGVDSQTSQSGSPELTGTVDDAEATVEVVVNGAAYAAINNGDGTWTLPAGSIAPELADGTYDIVVSATDIAENVGTDETADELTIGTPTSTGGVNQFDIGQFAAGAGPGGGGSVTVYNADRSVAFTATPFSPSEVPGGVRTAVADVNGDGTPDLIAGAGPGGAPVVRIIDGATRQILRTINAFESSFLGGLYVAAGDIDGDGAADVFITPDEGGGPRVRIFSGATGEQINDFFGIDDANFRGGARTAVGDVTGDGRVDLVVAAGFGGGPRIAVFDGLSVATGTSSPLKPFEDFFAFEQTLRNGVFIASGDVDGDGRADIIAGGGPGGGPRVLVLPTAQLRVGNVAGAIGNPIGNFFGGDVNNRGGIRVAAKDLDGDDRADLVLGVGEEAGSTVTTYLGIDVTPNRTPPEELRFSAFPGFGNGVFVG